MQEGREGVNRWSISVTCALCAASIRRSGDDAEQLNQQCESQARADRWVEMPERAEPRRYAGWICRECADDVVEIAL